MSGHLVVEASGGIALVQDMGRAGRMAEGVPCGGAMVPDLLAAANRAVGNRPSAAGIEVYGRIQMGFDPAVGNGRIAVAWADGAGVRAWSVHEGEGFGVATDGASRVGYIAVAGGLAEPEVLGGRGTLPTLRIGGHEGRPLRRGDRIQIGETPLCIVCAAHDRFHDPAGDCHQDAMPDAPSGTLDFEAAIRIMPGPDDVPGAVEALCGASWAVSSIADRMGYRLEGPALASTASAGPSAPMTPGAIQIAAGGQPIVLGPDCGTIGGYPVAAVVLRADRGLLFARRPGAPVRFVRA